MHLITMEVVLSPGSSATPNSSVQNFRKDNTFSLMPVGFYHRLSIWWWLTKHLVAVAPW